MDVTVYGALSAPDVVEGEAVEIFSELLFVPQQQLVSRSDGSTAAVQNPTSILKRHQILLFIITGAIHVPERTRDSHRRKEND